MKEIEISVKLGKELTADEIQTAAVKALGVSPKIKGQIRYRIMRRSIDARNDILYRYRVEVYKPDEVMSEYVLEEYKNVADAEPVIIVGAGENNTDIGIGVAWCGEDNVAVHDACYTLKHNQNPKYISYCLRTKDYHEQIKKYVSSGKICAISAAGISKAKIPLPPIEEQNRIVAILDRYDAIYTDISLAIPEEIEARQKQYEYYRDKLLTFKELSV